AFPGALRAELAGRGIAALQCYGTADLGLIAYETRAPDGSVCEGMVIDEGVVTTLTPEYPLIRFATGDLSELLPGPSPCGRTNQRLRGWLGRADQSVKVRGLFVHPSQVAEILRRHPAVLRGRLIVERPQGADAMTLLVETEAPEIAAAEFAESIQA